jgi:trans-aconitate methyltransferase
VTPMIRYSAAWLGRREEADGRARSPELPAVLAADLQAGVSPAAAQPLVVHDLGSGTGSMARWLAPLLPGPQHWVLHDRDADLLDVAVGNPPAADADGSPVAVERRPGDVTRLTAADLSGAALVTASALLDLLTRDEVEALAEACEAASTPALLALSVVGRVELAPAHPSDAAVAAAFDAHQRRVVAGRRLLGPYAAAAAALAFDRRGARVDVRATRWELGPADDGLIADWLNGWVGAAGEQDPDLRAGCLEHYLGRRLEQAAGGRLTVTVHHEDLLARWP